MARDIEGERALIMGVLAVIHANRTVWQMLDFLCEEHAKVFTEAAVRLVADADVPGNTLGLRLRAFVVDSRPRGSARRRDKRSRST